MQDQMSLYIPEQRRKLTVRNYFGWDLTELKMKSSQPVDEFSVLYRIAELWIRPSRVGEEI